MKNSTVSANYNFTAEQEAGILKAFTDSNVIPGIETINVRSIQKQMTGYGHWKITVSVELDGTELTLTAITTDSVMIDEWNDEDGNYNLDTLVNAFDSVITENEYEIADALIADETETDPK